MHIKDFASLLGERLRQATEGVDTVSLVGLCIPVTVRFLIASAVRSDCGQAAAVQSTSLLLHPAHFPAVRQSGGLDL